MLVQNDAVMAPKFKFEMLKRRHDALDVIRFLNDAESKRENRKNGVDVFKSMIAAFIDKNYVI